MEPPKATPASSSKPIFLSVAENKYCRAYKDQLKKYPLDAALKQHWNTDAHFICYDSDVRVKKDYDKPILARVFALDFDNPDHEPWKSDDQRLAWFDYVVENIENWYAVYTTRSGGRVVFALDNPVNKVELDFIYSGFKDLLGVDTQCLTWTRMFRLPFVRRPEPTWEDPFVELVIAGDSYDGSNAPPPLPSEKPGPEVRDLVWKGGN